MARRKKYKNPFGEFIKRSMRSLLAVIVLTALVLGISYGVKTVSTLNANSLARMSGPILSKLGISEEQAGQVAGEFIQRLGQTDIGEGEASSADGHKTGDDLSQGTEPTGEISSASTSRVREETPQARIAVFADSHLASSPAEYAENKDLLQKAVDKAKSESADVIVHVGDISNLGLEEDLSDAKAILDNSGVKYYAIPGDRDLWKTVGTENFESVFGEDFHTFEVGGFKFVMLDNSANYSVIDGEVVGEFESELGGAEFVFLSQPLYHPNNIVMGVVDGETVVKVKEQADELLGMIRNSKVEAVIAGDHHSFSVTPDPEDPNLEHIVAGAITRERNLQQGKPRILMLNLFSDGGYTVDDVALE